MCVCTSGGRRRTGGDGDGATTGGRPGVIDGAIETATWYGAGATAVTATMDGEGDGGDGDDGR